jgi:hypothetical protein
MGITVSNIKHWAIFIIACILSGGFVQIYHHCREPRPLFHDDNQRESAVGNYVYHDRDHEMWMDCSENLVVVLEGNKRDTTSEAIFLGNYALFRIGPYGSNLFLVVERSKNKLFVAFQDAASYQFSLPPKAGAIIYNNGPLHQDDIFNNVRSYLSPEEKIRFDKMVEKQHGKSR